jgi:hypothetical protein
MQLKQEVAALKAANYSLLAENKLLKEKVTNPTTEDRVSATESEGIAIDGLVSSLEKLQKQCVEMRKKWESNSGSELKPLAMNSLELIEEYVLPASCRCDTLVMISKWKYSKILTDFLFCWAKLTLKSSSLMEMLGNQNSDPETWQHAKGEVFALLGEMHLKRQHLNDKS